MGLEFDRCWTAGRYLGAIATQIVNSTNGNWVALSSDFCLEVTNSTFSLKGKRSHPSNVQVFKKTRNTRAWIEVLR